MFKNFLRAVFRMTKVSPEGSVDALQPAAAIKRAEPAATEALGEPAAKKPKKIPNRKWAMFMAYQGKNYFGMQFQKPGTNMPTIESNVLDAMLKCGIIDGEQLLKPFSFSFQRAARTDRKVSAVRQVCSFMLPLTDEFVSNGHELLNAHLPPDIRILTIRRATPSFHCQKKCDYRTYSYTIPTFAFAGTDSLTQPSFRMTPERRQEVNDVLKCFVGTHNFFNYTAQKEHKDQSCNRYIISFECGEPFTYVHDFGVKKTEYEFATIYIKGQSFMMHQIRKMIGMTLTILRGFQNKSDITRSFESLRLDVPRAPGLGLILEQVHYQNYDKFFGNSHGKLDSLGEEIEARVKQIREEIIISEILQSEVLLNSMMLWLADLPKHDFNINPESETQETRSALAMARAVAADAVSKATGIPVKKEEPEDDGVDDTVAVKTEGLDGIDDTVSVKKEEPEEDGVDDMVADEDPAPEELEELEKKVKVEIQ